MGYFLNDSFSNDDFRSFWDRFMEVSGLILVPLSYSHVYVFKLRSLNREDSLEMAENVRASRRDFFAYFFYMMVLGLVVPPIVAVFYDPDGSYMNCNASYLIAHPVMFLNLFLFYRLIISKSRLYDPLDQATRTTKATYYILHFLWCPFVIYAYVRLALTKRDIVEVEGKQRCIEYISGLSHTVFMLCDLLISILCAAILFRPITNSSATRPTKRTAMRNVVTMALASISTLLFILYLLTASERDGSFRSDKSGYMVIDITIRVGYLVLVFTFLMAAFSWPLKFYGKVAWEHLDMIFRTRGVTLTIPEIFQTGATHGVPNSDRKSGSGPANISRISINSNRSTININSDAKLIPTLRSARHANSNSKRDTTGIVMKSPSVRVSPMKSDASRRIPMASPRRSLVL
ncbi:hypothetical protein AAMO2058_000820300 [Amorphochlora amoebiformis]